MENWEGQWLDADYHCLYIRGSGIVQIQETGNGNVSGYNQRGGGGRRGGKRGRENSLLSSSCYLPLFILFSLFRAILHYLDAWNREITASTILLVIFKTFACGLARKLNPRHTDQCSSIWAHPRRLIFITLYLPIHWAIPHKEYNQPVWPAKKQNKTKTTEDNIKT